MQILDSLAFVAISWRGPLLVVCVGETVVSCSCNDRREVIGKLETLHVSCHSVRHARSPTLDGRDLRSYTFDHSSSVRGPVTQFHILGDVGEFVQDILNARHGSLIQCYSAR